MQSSLHDIVDSYKNPLPISKNYYFRGGTSTRRTTGGATQDRRSGWGEEEVAHGQEKLNFAI